MRDQVKAIPKLLVSIIGKALKLPIGILYRVLHGLLTSPTFSIFMLIAGMGVGFGVGARMFETGGAESLGVGLKGQNVKISGPCRIEGEVRKPALAEDEVKIVSIDSKKLVGIVRATRETVECDVETTAIDHLPLLRDLMSSPVEIPQIQPFSPNREDSEVTRLSGKTIRASGACELKDSVSTDPFIDQEIEVINVERSATDRAVLKIAGIMKKTKLAVNCTSRGIKYSILNQDSTGASVMNHAPEKRDLVGEIILVTSNCFPDHRLPPSKKNKTVYYPLIDARMKVVQSRFDDEGRLSYIAGAIIENGALVECDSTRYPINWKPHDDRIKLVPIKGSIDSSAGVAIEPLEQAPAESTTEQ